MVASLPEATLVAAAGPALSTTPPSGPVNALRRSRSRPGTSTVSRMGVPALEPPRLDESTEYSEVPGGRWLGLGHLSSVASQFRDLLLRQLLVHVACSCDEVPCDG
jgi:hypothetical protein